MHVANLHAKRGPSAEHGGTRPLLAFLAQNECYRMRALEAETLNKFQLKADT